MFALDAPEDPSSSRSAPVGQRPGRHIYSSAHCPMIACIINLLIILLVAAALLLTRTQTLNRLAISTAVLLQLIWFSRIFDTLPPELDWFGTYRLQERIAAQRAYFENPSAATQAPMVHEINRYREHQRTVRLRLASIWLLADLAAIYFFWNVRPKPKPDPATALQQYQCPACHRPLYNRRLTQCGFCGAKLPEALTLTPDQIAALDQKLAQLEHERLQREQAPASPSHLPLE
jgi:hypothetical protein